MAFLIHSTDDGRVLPLEYITAGAIASTASVTTKVGMAMTKTDGNLVVASGTTKPTYISMREQDTALTADDLIPVVRVQPDVIFETELSAAGTSLKVGQKVTLATDGLRVTATTTDGVAELVEIIGTEIGGKVRVRF